MSPGARGVRKAFASPGLLLAGSAVLLFLLAFVLWPLLSAAATPSLQAWQDMLTAGRWRQVAAGTLWLTALSTASAVVLGLVFALAVTKLRVPGWRVFAWIPLLGLFSPPFVGALAIILLFGRNGLVTSQLLGLDVSLYGWHGVWFSQTLSFFPLAYMVLVGVLRRVPASLEQAAAGYGSGSLAVLRSVTLPLARPGILAATLFVSLGVLSDFGTPMILGGRFRVLATEAYNRVTGWGDLQGGAVLGLLLLVPALVIYFVQARFAAAERFATVGGRGSFDAPLRTALAPRVLVSAVCAAVGLVLVAKLGAIAVGGVATVWGFDYTPTLDHLSWLRTRSSDLANTMQYALLAALLGTAVSLLAAFLVHAVRVRGRGALDLLTLLPAAVPGTLLGIAFVLTFNTGPLRLTGTAAIIIITMTVGALPTAYRICAAALQQVNRSLFEAASNLGAGWLAILRDVALPLLRGPAGSAATLLFIHGIGTLSAVIFVVAPGRNLASVSILNLAEEGYWGGAAAIATVLIVLAGLVLLLARLLLGRNFRPFESL